MEMYAIFTILTIVLPSVGNVVGNTQMHTTVSLSKTNKQNSDVSVPSLRS